MQLRVNRTIMIDSYLNDRITVAKYVDKNVLSQIR